jgi:Ca-activated chloride channel family protein
MVERTSSQVRAELRDRVLHYEITETFVNRGGAIAEADYLFPLPRGAAFQDLALEIGGELVSGETLSATEARGIYEEIVRRQRDPALVEYMGRGLLRTRIFPIAAGEEKRVVVRIQAVAEREGRTLRVDYARSVRGSMQMSVREGSARVHGEPSRTFTLSWPLSAPYGMPYSPTHELRTSDRNGRRTVTAVGDAGDVTVLLPVRDARTASITLLAHAPRSDSRFALLTISPPAARARTTPRDVTLVVDVSGSMRGRKMEQARAAGRQWLETLHPDDRFRIIDFSTDVRAFRDDYVPATDANLRAARRYLDGLDAEGSTNIAGALDVALGSSSGNGRMPLVLFVTDGEPTVGERNPDAIASRAASHRGRARLFTFGVGADVNAALVEQLAVEGRGTAHFVRPDESVERALELVARRLTSPVVTDVRVHLDGDARLLDVHPRLPADIFAGQDLVLLARYQGDGDSRVIVEGRTADGPVRWSERVHLPVREGDNAFVPRLWATQRIGWLAAEKRRGGGSREMDEEIRELGMRYGIPTEFSSYLVVEPGMSVPRPVANDLRRRASGRGASVSSDAIGTSPSAAPALQREARFEAAKGAAAQRSATSLAVVDSLVAANALPGESASRRVGTRTFVLVDGIWTDGRDVTGMRVIRVRPYSEAYFALLSRLVELRDIFPLGERVRVAGTSVAIELAGDGVDAIDERELDRIVRAW